MGEFRGFKWCPECKHAPPHEPGKCQGITSGALCTCQYVAPPPPPEPPEPPPPPEPSVWDLTSRISVLEQKVEEEHWARKKEIELARTYAMSMVETARRDFARTICTLEARLARAEEARTKIETKKVIILTGRRG